MFGLWFWTKVQNLKNFISELATSFKGTVARDFLAWVFFMDPLYMGLRFWGLKDFLFFFVFAKLFEYFDESAQYATVGIQKYFFEDSKTNGKIR